MSVDAAVAYCAPCADVPHAEALTLRAPELAYGCTQCRLRPQTLTLTLTRLPPDVPLRSRLTGASSCPPHLVTLFATPYHEWGATLSELPQVRVLPGTECVSVGQHGESCDGIILNAARPLPLCLDVPWLMAFHGHPSRYINRDRCRYLPIPLPSPPAPHPRCEPESPDLAGGWGRCAAHSHRRSTSGELEMEAAASRY